MSNKGEKKIIIVFAPHPDDETIGCGGTIATKIAAGYEVVIVVLTNGENLFSVVLDIHSNPSPSEIGELRVNETIRATELLGVPRENIQFWEYEDGSLERDTKEVTEKVLHLVHEKLPAEVYCHSKYEAHKDHRATHEIVSRACEVFDGSIKKYQYITSLKYGLTLDDLKEDKVEVDISAHLSLKEKALDQFQSHLGKLYDCQRESLIPDFKGYLTGVETFLIDD